jgi:hypothetical protein
MVDRHASELSQSHAVRVASAGYEEASMSVVKELMYELCWIWRRYINRWRPSGWTTLSHRRACCADFTFTWHRLFLSFTFIIHGLQRLQPTGCALCADSTTTYDPWRDCYTRLGNAACYLVWDAVQSGRCLPTFLRKVALQRHAGVTWMWPQDRCGLVSSQGVLLMLVGLSSFWSEQSLNEPRNS